MTPNKKLLREALEKIAVCMPGSIMSRIATDALAATEQPVTSALVAVFEGYVDGKPRIAWTGAPLPAGTELYAAPITEQPARQDTAYAELQVRIERARKVCMDVDIHPDALENILADRDRLTERVTRAERALIRTGWQDLGGHEWKPPIGPGRDALTERVAALEVDIKALQTITDWLDSSTNVQQVGLYEYGHASQFDYELAQAASEISAIVERLKALATPHPHADEAAKVDNCALWDAIGKYAEADAEFMHASVTQIEKNTRAGSSLYVALKVAREELEALIGKRSPPSPAEGESA